MTEPVLYKQFQYFTHSLNLFEQINDKFGIGLNLIRIGVIYDQIGQPEKAFQYYEKALTVKKEIHDDGGTALALINIGIYYKNKNDLENSLKNFEESLIYRLKAGTKQGIAYAQVNIGEVLFRRNMMSESLVMVDSAIDNFSGTTDFPGQIWSLYLKGQVMQRMNKPDEAEKLFQIIINYPEKFHYLYYVLEAKKELVKNYSERGDIKKAFQLQSEYMIAKDTLARRDYRTETQRLVNEFEFKKQEEKEFRDNALAQQHINRRNSLEYLSIAVGVIVLFVILFSGRRRLSNGITNALLLVGLLLLFEFLLVLTDSSVERLTGGEPILKLLANLVLALLILPGHQFLERNIQKRFLKKDVITES